jgi:hypothetical protein
VELKPGGASVAVTPSNKREYVDLMLRWRLLDSVAPQLAWLLRGLYEVVPKPVLAVFDYQVRTAVLSGTE